MYSFRNLQDGRFFVHTLNIRQFQTRYLSIKLAIPMDRAGVTAVAMLPYLWLEGTIHYPDAKSLTRKTDDMYGTHIFSNIGKRGDRQVAEVTASFPAQEVVSVNADGQPVGEQPVDGQPVGGQPVGGQSVDGQPADGQPIAGQSADKQSDDFLDDVYDLMLEVITQPVIENGLFPETNVVRQKRLHRTRIESVYDDKISYAMERCLQETADDSPAGLPRLGFIEDIDAISPQSLWDSQQNLLENAEIHVYYSGPVGESAEAIDAFNERLLNKLKVPFPSNRWAPQTSVMALQRRHVERRRVVDPQDVTQGKLNLGFRTGISYDDPEYIPLFVANGILGGFPHSKLFINVREKASLAYYASSRLDALTGLAAIQTGIEIANYEQALAIILEQVEKMKHGEITQEELELTQRQLQNQYTQAFDVPLSLAEVHFSGQLVGIQRDVEDLIHQVNQVTIEDVAAAAQFLELEVIYFLRDREEAANA